MCFEKIFDLLLNVKNIIFKNIIMNAKEAIEIAKIELLNIFEDASPNELRLEEIELQHSNKWVITLSYIQDRTPTETVGLLAIAAAMNLHNRVFKVVTVNKSTGVVESIKIRNNG